MSTSSRLRKVFLTVFTWLLWGCHFYFRWRYIEYKIWTEKSIPKSKELLLGTTYIIFRQNFFFLRQIDFELHTLGRYFFSWQTASFVKSFARKFWWKLISTLLFFPEQTLAYVCVYHALIRLLNNPLCFSQLTLNHIKTRVKI